MSLPIKGYVVVAVEGEIPWTEEDLTVDFQGHKLLLRPGTADLAPTVVFAYASPMEFDDALQIIRRFLSSITWAEGRGIHEFTVSGGSFPILLGKRQHGIFHATLNLDYLPAPTDPKAQLALAFYREAKCVNSVPYQFLGYAKIINIRYADGEKQIAWINDAVKHIDDYNALERLTKLRTQGEDIGKYLFVSGRCAIAHAYSHPLVDPENPKDIRRLHDDLPLIKALAEYLIEYELGIKSQRTIWIEHLYELDGFREILGLDLISRLKAGDMVAITEIPLLPQLNFGVRGHKQLVSFAHMTTQIVGVEQGALLLKCQSSDKLLTMNILLDFAKERLQHDMLEGVKIIDDGSPHAIACVMDQLEFVKGLLHNGQFEIRSSEKDTLLGRCDPFLPTNIDGAATFARIEELISQLSSEKALRETQV